MSVPNLGVTQLIEQPGVGGTFAQGLAGVLQARMARQQAEQERLKNEAYNAYMQEQTATMRAARDRTAKEAAQAELDKRDLGLAWQQYMTPEQVAKQIPTFGGTVMPGLQVNVPRERSQAEVAKNLRPELIKPFVTETADIEQVRVQKREQRQAKNTLRALSKQMPARLRPAMDAVIEMEGANVPANLSPLFVSVLIEEGSRDPKAVAAMIRRFPDLDGLTPEKVMSEGVDLARGKARIAAGIERDPNRPSPDAILAASTRLQTASGSRPRTEVRKDISAINTALDNARSQVSSLLKEGEKFMVPHTNVIKKNMTPAEKTAYDEWVRRLGNANSQVEVLTQDQSELINEMNYLRTGQRAGVDVTPVDPKTEVIKLDQESGRRYAENTTTGVRRFIDPPR